MTSMLLRIGMDILARRGLTAVLPLLLTHPAHGDRPHAALRLLLHECTGGYYCTLTRAPKGKRLAPPSSGESCPK